MACIKADGSLTSWAHAMLVAVEAPKTDREVAAELNLPVFRVRASLRELSQADLVVGDGQRYTLTDRGREVTTDGPG